MKLRILAIVALLSVMGATAPKLVQAQDAAPNAPQQPGFWQPVALVNPTQPIQIQLINRTSLVLDYALTTNEAPPRQLQPGGSAALTKFALPAFLLISPTQTQISLQFNVKVTKNMIAVEIRQAGGATPGDSTLNINQGGGIYIY